MISISIITVVFNAADTLERTIKSVIEQKYENLEYIIIDGGSTDGTVEIIKKYENYINYWCSEPDDGIYAAMNKGLAHANGDIVGIINSDDWYEDSVFFHVNYIFEKNNIDVYSGKVKYLRNDGEFSLSRDFEPNDLFYEILPHQGTFYKRSLHLKYGYYNKKYKLAADYEFFLRCYVNSANFHYDNFNIAYFRLSGASTLHMDEAAREYYKIVQKYIRFAPNQKIVDEKARKSYEYRMYNHWIKNKSLDYIKDIFNQYRKIYIWGTGKWGANIGSIISNANIDFEWIDSDVSKIGQKKIGKQIISKEQIGSECCVFIAIKTNYNDVISYLEDNKIKYIELNHFLSCANEYAKKKVSENINF